MARELSDSDLEALRQKLLNGGRNPTNRSLGEGLNIGITMLSNQLNRVEDQFGKSIEAVRRDVSELQKKPAMDLTKADVLALQQGIRVSVSRRKIRQTIIVAALTSTTAIGAIIAAIQGLFHLAGGR